jgi:hypothetical protein
VFWNPAGLASGRPAGMTVGWVDFRTGDQLAPPVPGPAHSTSKFVSLGTWPVGVSYGHFQEEALVIQPDGTQAAVSVKTAQYGFTMVQTLLEGLVVGSTVKYVRGAASSMPIVGATAEQALDRASQLDTPSRGDVDFDLGLMADLLKVRVGLAVRNLRQPAFVDAAGFATVLHRESRMGVAVLPTSGLTLAMDLDLETVDLRDGPRRILALGGENRFGHRLELRSGVRWSIEGARRRVFAFGGSVSIRRNFWVDSHYTQGALDGDRGYGFAMRAGF